MNFISPVPKLYVAVIPARSQEWVTPASENMISLIQLTAFLSRLTRKRGIERYVVSPTPLRRIRATYRDVNRLKGDPTMEVEVEREDGERAIFSGEGWILHIERHAWSRFEEEFASGLPIPVSYPQLVPIVSPPVAGVGQCPTRYIMSSQRYTDSGEIQQ